MDYKAEILDPNSNVTRTFETDNLEMAKTATRNYPPGWRVRIKPRC